MAKTYKHLFPQIYAFDNLHAAYFRARRGKRERAEVQRFELDLEGEIIQLQNELIWGGYRTGPYYRFNVYEPKAREVASLPFRDRVLQHALVHVIEPIWESRFIADNYACRPGRGTHRGADRVQAMLRKVQREHGRPYVLKADIAKYFASIDHAILKRLFRKHIACAQTLALLDHVIDSANAIPGICGVGLPIGNLTSQLAANVYLHELDLFVKHQLREVHYVRYMDDFVIIGHDKSHLHRLRARIEDFLWRELRLKTNNKTQVFPVALICGRALDFLGYRIWPTHRKLRKSSISRISLTLRKLQTQYRAGQVSLARIASSVTSWVAHASQANTWGLRNKLLQSFVFLQPSMGQSDES